MEMKINFNKLFNLEQSSSHTPSTTSLQNSYQLQEPSMISTPSNHINLHYKFNQALFFDSELHQQNDHNMNILEDLSSIGRSFDQSFQKQKNQKLSKKKAKNNDFYKDEHDHSDIMRKQFNFNQKLLKTPGERLYYEGKIQHQRKQKQIDRIRHQIEIQNSKEITFKPALNEKSKKILEQAESPLRKLNNLKKSQKQKLSQKQIKPYSERKQQEQLKNCTFHPTLIKDSKNSYLPSSINDQRNPKKVFEQLYNEHKAKQMRRKQALKQQLEQKGKKMTLQQFEDFFQRNEEYLQQKQHREEIMRAVSSQYDLTSGRKLFEPKLHNPSSSTLFNSASGTKLINTPPSKKGYEYDDQSGKTSSPSLKKNTGSNNKRSGKSRESRSKSGSKKNLNQTKSFKSIVQKKSQKIISENKKQPKVNKVIKQSSKNQAPKQFKPNSYQVTKIGNTHLPQPVSSFKQQIEKKPLSNIFTKIRPTESLFEQRQQYEQQSDEDNFVEYKQQQINEYHETSEGKNVEHVQCNVQIDLEYQENDQDHSEAQQQQNQQDKRINIDQPSVHYKPSESEQQEGSGQNQNDNSNPFQQYENNFAQQNHQGTPEQKNQDIEEHKQQLIKQHYTENLSYEQQKEDQIQSISNKSHQNIYLQNTDNQKIIDQVQNNRRELCQQDQSIDQIESHSKNQQIQRQDEISLKNQAPQVQQSKQEIETLKNSAEESVPEKKQKSSFKEYIANNPKYCHKYKNLFEIENQDNGKSKQDQTPDQPVEHNSTNSKAQNAESILPLSYQKRENKIFLSKDSEQDVDQTEPTVNQWQMYYKRASNKSLLTLNQPKSTIKNSSDNNEHEKTQWPINCEPIEQSPKKKPINIASMLKGKKKPTQKAQN